MSVVHFKFKNSIEYDSITFDGLAISLSDLKKGIMTKKRMRPEDSDLRVINAQTGEVYSSANIMIPKNTSLTVSRIPAANAHHGVEKITAQEKAQKWAAFRQETQAAIRVAEGSDGGFNSDKVKKSGDLLNAPMSEMDKIAQMIKQSTKDFHPSNYSYKVMTGTPGSSYVCFKCGKSGHYIQNCPNTPADSSAPVTSDMRIKKPTGIPLEHMLIVSEALPGTYKTYTGQYAVPKIDAAAYATGKKEKPPFLPGGDKRPVVLKKPIPKELKCPLCGDLARDGVVIPCCGISYCDECIRNKLLETDDHVCPSCDSMDVSPDGLIANQMLRRAVTNFQNETGYTKIAANTAAVNKAKEAAMVARAQAQAKVIPRGPSVLDFKPPRDDSPPPPPPPPRPQVSSAAPVVIPPPIVTTNPQPQSVEPPTPTMDEPQTSLMPPMVQANTSAIQTIAQGESLSTIVGMRVVQQQRDPLTGGFYSAPPPVLMPPTVPYPIPAYPPPSLHPPPFLPPPVTGLMPPSVRPVLPPVVPQVIPQAVTRPPMNIPKPLSKHEFMQEKERLIREERHDDNDPLLEFQRELERREKKPPMSPSKPRSRTRSRSLSKPRYRSRTRSRGRSYSKSPRRFSPRRSRSPRRSGSPRRSRSLRRSISPRRSWTPRRSPRRSMSPRRSRSPYRRSSRSPRRSFTPRRSWSPRRSRSPRFRRSFSRSPVRRRSYSRSPFRRRSFSRSPRRSPFRRSRSRGRFSPIRRSRSPLRKSRSRSREFSRRRSNSISPNRRRSPFRDNNSRDRRSPIRRKKSPIKGNKERSDKNRSPKRDKSPGRRDGATSNIPTVRTSNKDTSIQSKSADQNKENIPNRKGTSKSNLVVINVVDHEAFDEEIKDSSAKIEDIDSNFDKKDIATNQETENKSEKVIEEEIEKNDMKDKKEQLSENKETEVDTSNKKETEKSNHKTESKKDNSGKQAEAKKEKERERKTDNKTKTRERRSRSRSRERNSGTQRSNRPRRRRSGEKKKSPSDSPSPPRVKAPLILTGEAYRNRDRGFGRGGRGRGGMRRDGRDQFMERDRGPPGPGPEYRGQEYMGFGRGEPPYRPLDPDFRVPPPGHQDFRPGLPDFRAQQGYPPDPHAPPPLPMDFHRRNSPGYPPNFNFSYPPRDPREDPNFQGQIRDEDVRKFEQYKQMYDMYYNRSYGFPPGPSQIPSGQTPPQGPPPAPPGTAPIPPLLGPVSAYDRMSPPRRHRSRSPQKGVDSRRDRRDYDRERGRDRPRFSDQRDRQYSERDGDRSRRSADRDRDRRSAERNRDRRSPDRERKSADKDQRISDRDRRDRSSPDRRTEKSDKHNKDRQSSPDRKAKESDEKAGKQKDKKAKKKKEKDSTEKKKKKKKEKTKDKVKKDKGKDDEESSADEEAVVKKKTKTTAETETSGSEAENTVNKKRRTHSAATQSESSDHEAESRKQSISEDKPSVKIENDEQETVVSSSMTETVKQDNESDNNTSDNETSRGDDKKRRSLKRTKPDKSSGEEADTPEEKVKKPKLENDKNVVESMETSGEKSPGGSDLDEIPQPEDELMLDPPEVSKWEKEDDPYDLSPEPTRRKEKWKPEKPTLLPRSVLEKAEKAFSQKVMKPTTIASAVSLPRPKDDPKKEVKSPEVKQTLEPHKKIVKSPTEPKRRVFMDVDKNKDERRAQIKQNSVKITVSSSKDDDRRKVSTGSGDLRDKISKRREEEPRHKGHSDDRRVKQDSHKERRDSNKEYSRQDSRSSRDTKSHRQTSRKDSVVDESRFVPDYDDDDSESDDNKYSEDSSSDSSSEEETRKKKHKKNKHKKDKKRKKDKKEKKKKKHKEKVKEGRKVAPVK